MRRGLLVLLAVVVLVVAGTAFEVWSVGRADSRRRSDAIVVLGASQFDGRPSSIFAARLDHAAALYQAGVAPRVVTVGGSRAGDRFTEGEAGASYLAHHGVPRSALVPVGRGRDTLLSLRAAASVFQRSGWRSAVLVTDPWHSLRSRRIARDLDIRAETSPVRSGPAVRGSGTQVRYVLRETGAYLFYRLFHRASSPGPPAV